MSFLAPCPRDARHQLTEIALPDCRVPYVRAAYGALNKSSEGGLLLRSTSAMPLQQFEGFKREATIVSAELDDEAAVIISCPRESGGGGVESAARSR